MRIFSILILLISLFSFFETCAQSLSLEDLLRLKDKSLDSFQESLYENNFLLYRSKSLANNKLDSITFINDEKTIVGRTQSRTGNIIFIENISDDYFKSISDQIKRADIILVDTKVISENTFSKIYINPLSESTIELHISAKLNRGKNIENRYALVIFKDPKFRFKYRKHIKS